MTSRAPHLDIAVTWADPELQELAVSAASDNFAGKVKLYASPDELRDLADRLQAFLAGRSERREFLLGQEDFAGFGTLRLGVLRKDFADTLTVEVALRANPSERLVQPESCVLRLAVPLADVVRFEADVRRIAMRHGTRAVLG